MEECRIVCGTAPAPAYNSGAMFRLALASVAAGVAVGLTLTATHATTDLHTSSQPTLARTQGPSAFSGATLVSRRAAETQVRAADSPEGVAADLPAMGPSADTQPTQSSGLLNVRTVGWSSIVAGMTLVLSAIYKMLAPRPQPKPYDHFVCCATSGRSEWPQISESLRAANLKSVSGQEALKMMNAPFGKAKLVDIRVANAYDGKHAAGSISVPLYRELEPKNIADNIKLLALASLQVEATEFNEDFIADCQKAGLNKGDKIIVCCTLGGTLDNMLRAPGMEARPATGARKWGQESRSLKACYELRQAGYKNVVHLDGGLNQWFYDGLPAASSFEE
uniref:Rhodanese domain-containing protein n=1 Tax=Eutreptiella gymnastica TaxID=73025 RepID=A0A7S4FUP2_9EUGL|eukprot:CAMPEP_0174286898 /NCGR_PEP_ID=MMETSP0809-20121228/13648_1 /TAXON_ID=73025 ORGANISM="Eutreptiella gymnastica-like, Strain CCMP1594" /NCGR_SAMPLE_ID=MMETSP0809 /ASSEMBLY_ACC=CAM_ASM_000658 /LENGTH=335 /DNA_ID=CAMNT_0015383169 /DNA_START=29 /DNA_END=1036 /DNA_ORIENTATION=-